MYKTDEFGLVIIPCPLPSNLSSLAARGHRHWRPGKEQVGESQTQYHEVTYLTPHNANWKSTSFFNIPKYQKPSWGNIYLNFPSITAIYHILTYLHLLLQTFKGRKRLGRKKKNKEWRERFNENHRHQKNHRKNKVLSNWICIVVFFILKRS